MKSTHAILSILALATSLMASEQAGAVDMYQFRISGTVTGHSLMSVGSPDPYLPFSGTVSIDTPLFSDELEYLTFNNGIFDFSIGGFLGESVVGQFSMDPVTGLFTPINLQYSYYDGVAPCLATTTRVCSTFASTSTFSITQLSGPAPVPEAATWAMMLLGMGAVGHMMRRRRHTVTVSCT